MKKKKAPATTGAATLIQTIDLDNPIIPHNGNSCQDPILFLDIGKELDVCLDQEDFHSQTAMDLLRRAFDLARLGLAHARAADKAHQERVVLERAIPL